LSGLSSFLPPFGTRVSTPAILSSYRDAIASLSERLGTDKWFLGSSEPTPLDALAFAYLHCLLHAHNTIRIDVTRRVNLVTWEMRVRSQIIDKFTQ
jgi:metaxin